MNPLNDIIGSVSLPEGKLVAGVSGGVDSMFLLALCIEMGRDITAAHVNYGKRGEESEADEKMVRDYCLKHNVPLFVKPFEVHQKGNFQQLARNFRYEFFEDVRVVTESGSILTAHHSDDNDESLLMQLFRGASTIALTGIPEARGRIYRPLLAISKGDIVTAAGLMEVPWREDRSNAENEFTRNRIRNTVIPELDKLFPDWRKKVHELNQNSNVLTESADALLGNITDRSGLLLKRDAWLKLSSALQQLAMQRWVLKQTGQGPSRAWLDTLNRLSDIQTGAEIDVHNDWTILRNRDDFTLHQKAAGTESKGSETRLTREQAESGFKQKSDSEYMIINTGSWSGKPDRYLLELSLDDIIFPLTIRTWRAGDRMQPLGMQGSKLVSDVLTDAHVDAKKKASIQVAQTFDGKICAVIFRSGKRGQPGIISHQFSCRETGKDTLIIALKNDV